MSDDLLSDRARAPCPIDKCTYGELAEQRVYKSMDTLEKSVIALLQDPEQIQPGQSEIKDARKVHWLCWMENTLLDFYVFHVEKTHSTSFACLYY